MAGELIAGLGAFKTMLDIAKGLKDINDAATRNAAVIELQEKILAAQAQQATLIERLGELERELAELKNWDAEKQGYELKDIGSGALAYALKETVLGAGSPHYICTNCYAQNHKSILQPQQTNIGRWNFLICPRCDADIWPSGGGRDYMGSGRGKRR